MSDIFEDGKFRTCNTPLAAYLKSEGFTIEDIDYSDLDHIRIIFADGNQALKDAVKSFRTCQAVGNIPLYYEAYKDLVNKIKRRIPVCPK